MNFFYYFEDFDQTFSYIRFHIWLKCNVCYQVKYFLVGLQRKSCPLREAINVDCFPYHLLLGWGGVQCFKLAALALFLCKKRRRCRHSPPSPLPCFSFFFLCVCPHYTTMYSNILTQNSKLKVMIWSKGCYFKPFWVHVFWVKLGDRETRLETQYYMYLCICCL